MSTQCSGIHRSNAVHDLVHFEEEFIRKMDQLSVCETTETEESSESDMPNRKRQKCREADASEQQRAALPPPPLNKGELFFFKRV